MLRWFLLGISRKAKDEKKTWNHTSRFLRRRVSVSNVRVDASTGRKLLNRTRNEIDIVVSPRCLAKMRTNPRERVSPREIYGAGAKFQCRRSRKLADANVHGHIVYAAVHVVNMRSAPALSTFRTWKIPTRSSRYFPFSFLSSFFFVFASRFPFPAVVSALRANCTRERRRMRCGFEKSETERPWAK